MKFGISEEVNSLNKCTYNILDEGYTVGNMIQNELLNIAYAYASSPNWPEVAMNLRDALVENGFIHVTQSSNAVDYNFFSCMSFSWHVGWEDYDEIDIYDDLLEHSEDIYLVILVKV